VISEHRGHYSSGASQSASDIFGFVVCINSLFSQVVADTDDGLLAAFSLFNHFRRGKKFALYRIADKYKL
jgi:hypothetical protein